MQAWEHLEHKIDRMEKTLHSLSQQIKAIHDQGVAIMSAISDFAVKMNDHNTKVDTAITNLTNDVNGLQAQITALQNSQGQITPADQKLLDDIETRAQGVSDKLEALDAMTPPVPPTA